jgi:hypothetical protein
MLATTPAGDAYTGTELAAMCTNAGFTRKRATRVAAVGAARARLDEVTALEAALSRRLDAGAQDAVRIRL